MICENRVWDEIEIGETAELRRLCTADDFYVFATVSGNHNPMHLADEDGDGDGVKEAIAPAMWIGSLVSALLGNIMPGAGTLYRAQNFRFHARARAGEEVRARVKVTGKGPDGEITLDTCVERISDGAKLCTGEAVVEAPKTKMRFEAHELPGLIVRRHVHFERLVELAQPLPPIPMAVVAPEEPNSLGGALLAAEHTIITPILIGDRRKIELAASEIGRSLEGIELLDEPDHAAASRAGVALVRAGRAGALMKGHLHTDELLRAVLAKDTGLRTARRLTHVFVMDVPGVAHPLLVTDAAINIAPDLKTKVDIVQNAIDLAISLGMAEPKVGVLSAVETVNPDIPSSVDAALLSKMCERGQITGGIVDGPLAMDNAVSIAAARTKGIDSPVAGHAEVLVVPNLDAGNMLAKQLTYLAGAEGAGLVMGARAPIVLTSRADGDMARMASCAIAALHWARVEGLDAMKAAAQ
ncbi:MAG: bifunctional enoyl-CoA hydratase/phosphate acetyltransferase [Rubrimonas sp.]|uniref:bifunctional enoyl-CoA hydratase/phosphate acetyltransferase n=1 Tax=Rubrimonas sp. TaxID=2036015 RepID=UPI002FDE554C